MHPLNSPNTSLYTETVRELSACRRKHGAGAANEIRRTVKVGRHITTRLALGLSQDNVGRGFIEETLGEFRTIWRVDSAGFLQEPHGLLEVHPCIVTRLPQ